MSRMASASRGWRDRASATRAPEDATGEETHRCMVIFRSAEALQADRNQPSRIDAAATTRVLVRRSVDPAQFTNARREPLRVSARSPKVARGDNRQIRRPVRAQFAFAARTALIRGSSAFKPTAPTNTDSPTT